MSRKYKGEDVEISSWDCLLRRHLLHSKSDKYKRSQLQATDMYCVTNPRGKSVVGGETVCRPCTIEGTRTYLNGIGIALDPINYDARRFVGPLH